MPALRPRRLEGIRIAIVLKWAGFGGAERQALLVARHLREVEGAVVEVQALTSATARATAMFREAGIPWHGRPGRWRGSAPRTVLRLARAAAFLRRARPDVLLPYCDVPNVVCGLTWHAAGAQTCVWNQRDTLPFHLGERFVRTAIALTPVISSNSEHGADLLVARGAPRERIRVIANGVSLAPPRMSRAEWRGRLGVGADDVVVTSIAHLYPRKDHETLLAAWSQACASGRIDRASTMLVLAGRSEGRRDLLETLARSLEIDDRVRFLGDVGDVAGLLDASDVGVLSSASGEGCPNGALEAMRAALPFVGTDLPGIREALGESAQPFLVPCGDTEALAAVLGRLCADPGLRAREGATNAVRARVAFGEQRMLDQTVTTILDGLELGRMTWQGRPLGNIAGHAGSRMPGHRKPRPRVEVAARPTPSPCSPARRSSPRRTGRGPLAPPS